MEWINVNKQLPKPWEDVIIYCKKHGVSQGCLREQRNKSDYEQSKGALFWENNRDNWDIDVRFWQPMPKAPK
jgi:hypothetical protein